MLFREWDLRSCAKTVVFVRMTLHIDLYYYLTFVLIVSMIQCQPTSCERRDVILRLV